MPLLEAFLAFRLFFMASESWRSNTMSHSFHYNLKLNKDVIQTLVALGSALCGKGSGCSCKFFFDPLDFPEELRNIFLPFRLFVNFLFLSREIESQSGSCERKIPNDLLLHLTNKRK